MATDTGLWNIPALTPATASQTGAFPTAMRPLGGMGRHDDGLIYAIERDGFGYWQIDEAAPGSSTELQWTRPADLTQPIGLTTHSGSRYTIDLPTRAIWRFNHPEPVTASLIAVLPASRRHRASRTSRSTTALLYVLRRVRPVYRFDLSPTLTGATSVAHAADRAARSMAHGASRVSTRCTVVEAGGRATGRSAAVRLVGQP